MKQYDSFIIGHISTDEIIEVDGTRYPFYGGAALFGMYSAHVLGAKVGLLTKMTPDQRILLDVLPLHKEDIMFLDSSVNTHLTNRYMDESRERRDVTVESIADPFLISEIPEYIDSKIYHMGGLLYGDFEDGFVEALAKKGMVAVDLQAFLRHPSEDKTELLFSDYEHKMRDIPHIHFLKSDHAEAEMITGISDRVEAAKKMHEWGAKEIFITHNTEILVYDGEDTYTIPLRPRNTSGRTGRGDTSFSAYITQRLYKSVPESLLWACAAVSLKIEQPEPLKNTKAEVRQYIKDFYPEFEHLITDDEVYPKY